MIHADASLVGSILDRRYRVTGVLARGGMSTVYRGIDTRLDRAVAIKVMHAHYAADRTFVARFEREARAAAQLHHPHVVTVYDQGIDSTGDQGHVFIVMELVDGGTLRDLLDARGALPLPLAFAIASPVLAALSAAHQADLVHRDMKPENILLGPDIVKVADFGLVLAMAGASTTSSSVLLGTVAYLSPEQVTTGAASARSDVYAIGLLLFEMLTGRAPYTGDTAISVAYRHVNEDVPAPSSSNLAVPTALDQLVLRATRRDPAARHADAAELLTELEQLRAELAIAPVAVPALPPPDIDRDVDGGATDDTLPITKTGNAGPHGTRTLTRTSTAGAAQIDEHEQDDEKPDDERHERTSKRRSGVLAALTTVALTLLGVGIWWFTFAQTVAVPDVEGMDQSRAEATLAEVDLTAEVSKQRHNSAEAGTAIGTDPAAGSEVDTAGQIELVISLGRPVVPDIREGTSQADAEAAITDVALEPQHDSGADEYHESVPEGTVLRVSPEPGTLLDVGEQVTLVLSQGAPPDPVPDVTGLNRDDAFAQLREEGFEPYESGQEYAEGVAAGDVVRTEPEAGATPEDDTPRVGVYVSNAVEVPDVTARTVDGAEDVLDEHGLVSEVDGGSSSGIALVISQNPEPGNVIEPGGTVTLTVFP